MCINTFPFQIKERLCLFLSQKTVKKVIRQQLFQENTAFDSLVARLRRVHCPKPKVITIMKPNQTHTHTLRCTVNSGESCWRTSTRAVQGGNVPDQLIQIPCSELSLKFLCNIPRSLKGEKKGKFWFCASFSTFRNKVSFLSLSDDTAHVNIFYYLSSFA